MEAAQNRTTVQALSTIWAPAFIAALRETGLIRDACEACGIGRRTAYDLRERDDEFRAAWDEAKRDASDLLLREAQRRARQGVREPVVYKGQLQGVWVNEDGDVVSAETPGAKLVPLCITKYSDGLLMFLIKGERPEYNPGTHNTTSVNVKGDATSPVKVEHDHQHEHNHHLPANVAVIEYLRDLGLPCPGNVPADGDGEPVDRGDGAHPAP